MKKKSLQKIMSFCGLMAVFSALTAANAQAIRVGDAELLYTMDEIPIRYDGTISTLRKEGNAVCFFGSFGCRFEPGGERRSRHWWFSGPPEGPLKIHLESRTEEECWDYNGHYQDTAEAGIWILAVHRLATGGLLAVTHAEYRYPDDRPDQYASGHRFALGLGDSTDGGDHWTYCGEIAKAANDAVNVGGGAYILREGYIYAYFNDTDTASGQRLACVVRAPLDEVVQAAVRYKVTTWHKYRDGKWDVPGLSGRPGGDILPRGYGGEDLHADAAFCTALDQYLMTIHTHGAGKLLLFSSEDGLDWKQTIGCD
ncbi:hypothetical protein [Tichowtungia aerotolerans]|uniref:Uncharacterized protein n=1 Tax=Tichowtungia aerotolerans TaxID=2697043 RepID=A0A6P1M9S7_9BACT|nr:hypothetical protein [Tichowtungia aerotolerans]QHI69823.1 hypothetical protein GT409_10300 [Tichowtungia aerotolerans]